MKRTALPTIALVLASVVTAFAQTPPATGGAAPTTPPAATAQPAAAALTADQKTSIRTAILAEKATPAANVTFTVAAGTAVPTTVELRKLPDAVVKLMPGWKDYKYFTLADGRIVVVDGSAKIAMVVTA